MKNKKVVFKQVKHFSPEYMQALYLRYKLLRQPLDLHFNKEDLLEEKGHLHICGIMKNRVVAYLCMIPFPENRLRMRQVAVQQDLQGLEIGTQLIEYTEKLLKERQTKEIFLHARQKVVPFYQKLGYETCGEQFIEVGLPHYRMRKVL